MRYFILLLLAGCTPENGEALQRFGDALQGKQDEIKECEKLGFKPDTEAFANCRLQIRAMNTHKSSQTNRTMHCSRDAVGNYNCY